MIRTVFDLTMATCPTAPAVVMGTNTGRNFLFVVFVSEVAVYEAGGLFGVGGLIRFCEF